MKRINNTIVELLAAMALTYGSPLFSQQSVGVSPSPKTINVVGNSDVEYNITKWPVFGPSKSDNEACANILRRDYSARFKNETPIKDLTATHEPISIISKSFSLSGLGLSDYRKTAKIVVSWTVRVEAYKGPLVNPWTPIRLCYPWHGSILQDFAGGDVDSMLYIDEQQMGNTATMTIPPLGSDESINVSDPTITNSITLGPENFNGVLPDTINLSVRWVNKTAGSKIKSPAYMRNMTIFIAPVGRL